MKLITLFTILALSSSLFAGHDHQMHEKARYETDECMMHYKEDHKPAPTHHKQASHGHHHMKKGHMKDGRIAYALSKSNKAEIKIADSIKHRLQSDEVRGLAMMMIKEHGESEMKLMKLLKEEGILLSPSYKMGDAMHKEKEAVMYSLLNKSKSAELDRAYVKSQIEMHEKVLWKIEHKFIPSAKNEAFKSFLYTKRDVVARHLEHARSLLNRL